jgi:DNA replication and repair protein RecF
MQLRELELDEFRSFHHLRLPVEPSGFRLVGPNASGKSTILEAISMLATTRSPRTASEREIANWQSGSSLSIPPYARASGVVERNDGRHTVEIGISLEAGLQGPLKKILRLDDRGARAVDVVGEVKCVLFAPENVDLVAGPPSGRRRYLDVAMSQASRPYLRALSRYAKVLEQRNSLLRSFARDRSGSSLAKPAEELAFWDAELCASGADVLAFRLGAIRALGVRAGEHFGDLAAMGTLSISYAQSRVGDYVGEFALDWRTPPQPMRQSLSSTLMEALASSRPEELKRGVTALGPHRDDFVVSVDGIDLGRFGSRGQQRLALIAMKLAELDLLSEAADEPPILLLDDILSELDAVHRGKVILKLASRRAQVCVTATDIDDLSSEELEHLPLWRACPGGVEPVGRS